MHMLLVVKARRKESISKTKTYEKKLHGAPLVGEVIANLLRTEDATWSERRIPRPYYRFSRQEPLLFKTYVGGIY
jgi:hypothetical protein